MALRIDRVLTEWAGGTSSADHAFTASAECSRHSRSETHSKTLWAFVIVGFDIRRFHLAFSECVGLNCDQSGGRIPCEAHGAYSEVILDGRGQRFQIKISRWRGRDSFDASTEKVVEKSEPRTTA